jgi:hypothetical protein
VLSPLQYVVSVEVLDERKLYHWNIGLREATINGTKRHDQIREDFHVLL